MEMKSHTVLAAFLINVICSCRVGSQLVDDINIIMNRLSALDALLTHHMQQQSFVGLIIMSLNNYMRYLQILISLPLNNVEKATVLDKFLLKYPNGPQFLSTTKTCIEMKRDFHCSANTVLHIKLKLSDVKTKWTEAYKSIVNMTCPHFSVDSWHDIIPNYIFR